MSRFVGSSETGLFKQSLGLAFSSSTVFARDDSLSLALEGVEECLGEFVEEDTEDTDEGEDTDLPKGGLTLGTSSAFLPR